MKAKTRTARKPLDWQRDPSRIDTATVQYWRNGSMITAMMTADRARQLVRDGAAFVITGQAIGALDANGCYAS